MLFVRNINNDHDYNQYHYPQQYKGYEEYSSYNYEGGIHESPQFNIKDNIVEQVETNEGLLCKEDEVDTLYDVGLEQ